MDILDTGIKVVKNVNRYIFGKGALSELDKILASQRNHSKAKHDAQYVIYFIDDFFKDRNHLLNLTFNNWDKTIYVSTKNEPTTEFINYIVDNLNASDYSNPAAIVGIGGGITLDTAKAVSNLLTNGGRAEDYQGWDLVEKPGVFKIGIPTISGTGAEATRTCVLTNKKTGLKLGMNSDYTVFDYIILDPILTSTVERNQFFYTGMDAYIHCIESLNGSYRNSVGDAFSRESVRLCREIFYSDDMMSEVNREKMMVASYLGGCAIATSYVGLIHPISAGLSIVLGLHHCISNCIVFNAMAEFYNEEYIEFQEFIKKQGIYLPTGICSNLGETGFRDIYNATMLHSKPLTNALGEKFRDILTYEKIVELCSKM